MGLLEDIALIRSATICPCSTCLHIDEFCWSCGKQQKDVQSLPQTKNFLESVWSRVDAEVSSGSRKHHKIILEDGRETEWTATRDGKLYDSKGKLAPGTKTRDGYLVVKVRGIVCPIHRLICFTFHGPPPVDEKGRQFDVDHIDFVRTNNCPSNLRWLSASENRTRHRPKESINEKWTNSRSFKKISN